MQLNDHDQQKLLGHTGRCFDIRYSSDGNFLLSASEDGTAILWDVKTRKVCTKIKHNKECEVLRVAYLNTTSSLITTCGADGKAIIWEYSEDNPAPHDISTEPKIASSSLNGNVHQDKKRLRKQAMLSHGEAQIYACECLDVDNSSSGMFMTAAESSVYLWDINVSLSTKLSSSPTHIWTVNTNSSNNSSLVNAPGDDSGFGGPRNPQNQIYIFDAKINPQCGSNIALALSDCNIQQIDLRTPALVSSNGLATPFSSSMKNSSGSSLKQSSSNGNFDSISLSGFSTSSTKKARVGNSHATSVSFSDDGLSLLAALGSGDIAVVDLRMGIVRTLLHSHTRTCFGAAFNTPSSSGTVNRGKRTQNNHDDNSLHDDVNGDLAEVESSLTGDLPHSSSSQCISWSSDCSIRSWDISVDGLCTEPVDVLIIPDFPIYSCTMKNVKNGIDFTCGGGNGETSFIGTPIHLFSKPI